MCCIALGFHHSASSSSPGFSAIAIKASALNESIMSYDRFGDNVFRLAGEQQQLVEQAGSPELGEWNPAQRRPQLFLVRFVVIAAE